MSATPSRRAFLTAAGWGAAGAATAAVLGGCDVGADAPPAEARPTTFVLVHGSGSHAAFWTPVATRLVLAGHRAVAVDLPGHGLDGRIPAAYQAPQDTAAFAAASSAVAGLTPDMAAAGVADVVRTVAAHGPVVLVGHSLGGVVVTRTADLVHEVLDHLVYVSAVCATALPAVTDYLGQPEAADSLLVRLPPTVATDPTTTGVTRTNFRTADPTFLDAFRAAVYAGMPEEEFLAVTAVTQQPDESVALNTDDARGDPQRWGRVPRTYVRLGQDRSLPPALQDRWIREADAATPDNRFTTVTLEAPHGAPITHADDVARALSGTA